MVLRVRLKTPEQKAARAKASQKAAAKEKEERLARLKPHQWKPGQSGNPLGPPPGTGSIVNWLKKRLAGPAFRRPDKFACLAQELADIILKQARRGNYNFMQMLLDKAESRQMNEDQLAGEIEKMFEVVRKHVQDKDVLEKIATDLGRNAQNKTEE